MNLPALLSIFLVAITFPVIASADSNGTKARHLAEQMFPLVKAFVENGDRSKGQQLARLQEALAALPTQQLPSDQQLRKLRTGIWQTTRHAYRYLADGRFAIRPKSAGSTSGTWAIRSGVLTTRTELRTPERGVVVSELEVLLLDRDFLITRRPEDGKVFFQYRLKG